MRTDFATETYLSDSGEYVIKKVTTQYITPIPLSGDAIITHVGLNRRFKFKIGSLVLVSTFVDNIAINENQNNKAYNYKDVKFNIDIKTEYANLYYSHKDSVNFWKAI